MLNGLLPILCLDSFLIPLRTPVGWALSHRWAMKKMPHWHVCIPLWSRWTVQLALFQITRGMSNCQLKLDLSVTLPPYLFEAEWLFFFIPITLLMLQAFKVLCIIFKYLIWNILLARSQPSVIQTNNPRLVFQCQVSHVLCKYSTEVHCEGSHFPYWISNLFRLGSLTHSSQKRMMQACVTVWLPSVFH